MPIPIVLSDAEEVVIPPPPPPPAEEPSYTQFYLLQEQLAPEYYRHMVALPVRITFNGTVNVLLVAAQTTNEQNVAIIGTQPQPAGWTGTAEAAASALRGNGLTNLWYLFDWFLAKYGVAPRVDPVTPPDPAPFVVEDYAVETTVYNPDGLALDTALYQVTHAVVAVAGGVNLTYTVKNIGSEDANWPSFRLSVPALDYRGWWWGDCKWKRDATKTPFVNPHVIESLYGSGIPNGNMFNCLAIDNAGGSGDPAIIGWSTDFPYFTDTFMAWFFPNKIVVHPNFFLSGSRALPIYLRPGQTVTIRFWLRHKAETGQAASLEVCQPYVDLMHLTCPSRQPPRLNGRVVGTLISDEGGDPAHRWYRTYAGKRVDEFDGWGDYLHNGLNLHFFGENREEVPKRHGYVAEMLWSSSGFLHDNLSDFVADLRDTSPNLAATWHEIPTWEASYGLKLMLWFGHAYSAYQAEGWDSPLLDPLATGNYTGITPSFTGPLPEGWQPWSLKPEALAFFQNNQHFLMNYLSGGGFDALPNPVSDPWSTDLVAAIRTAFPENHMAAEQYASDRHVQWASPFHLAGLNQFEGRCPMLELLFPDYEPWIQTGGSINPQENYNSRFVEFHGGCVVTHGPMLLDPFTRTMYTDGNGCHVDPDPGEAMPDDPFALTFTAPPIEAAAYEVMGDWAWDDRAGSTGTMNDLVTGGMTYAEAAAAYTANFADVPDQTYVVVKILSQANLLANYYGIVEGIKLARPGWIVCVYVDAAEPHAVNTFNASVSGLLNAVHLCVILDVAQQEAETTVEAAADAVAKVTEARTDISAYSIAQVIPQFSLQLGSAHLSAGALTTAANIVARRNAVMGMSPPPTALHWWVQCDFGDNTRKAAINALIAQIDALI